MKPSILKQSILMIALNFAFQFSYSQNINLSNYQLDWSDEFNGTNTDLENKWISENATPTATWHLASRWRENVNIENDILEITNKKENRGGKEWTSGSVWTKRQFTYGYFEAEYRYAGATGTNNSFWLWPRTGSPAGAQKYEVDINEGHYPSDVATNVHNWSDTWDDNGVTKHPVDSEHFTYSNKNLGDDYHVYGLEWTPTVMNFYFDNQLIRSVPNINNHYPTNIMFSLAILNLPSFVGPVTDAIDGTSMKVKYVRYYKPKIAFNTNQQAQFYIVNKLTGKKLRVSDKTSGSKLNQGASDWVGDQNKWVQDPTDSGYFYLRNVYSGLYFRPENDDNLSKLIQNSTQDGYAQWRRQTSSHDGHYFLTNRQNGKIFRGVNDQNFAEIEQRPSDQLWQSSRWKFIPAPITSIPPSLSTNLIYSKQSINDIQIYPNPAKGDIYFSTEANSYKIEIFDISGSLIQSFNVADNSLIELSSGNLSKGIYIVSCVSENTSKVQKLIIE